MTALFIALVTVMFIAVVLGCLCFVLGRDNERMRRRAWDRLKTANRLRNMRMTHRLLEDFVNDPIADDTEFVQAYLRN